MNHFQCTKKVRENLMSELAKDRHEFSFQIYFALTLLLKEWTFVCDGVSLSGSDKTCSISKKIRPSSIFRSKISIFDIVRIVSVYDPSSKGNSHFGAQVLSALIVVVLRLI